VWYSCDGKSFRLVPNFSFPVTSLTCLAITLHFISDEFELREELLAFIPIAGSYTGESITEHVYNTLDKFKIKDKFFCIMTDNTSNNYKMVEILSKLLLEMDGIYWDWKTNHIPCLIHTINLVVQKFLKNLAIGNDDDSHEDGDKDLNEDFGNDDDTDPASISGLRLVINKICVIVKSI